MKELIGVGAVLFAIALLIKYWWVVLIVGVIAGAAYLIVKYSTRTATTRRPPPSAPAVRPVVSRPSRPAQPSQQYGAPRFGEAPAAVSPSLGIARRQRIPRTTLTRHATGLGAGQAVFTAIDLETTGLDGDTDRIVEIGLVKFTADGHIIDEFATMVNNPGSTREARDVHQISDSDLDGAPNIADALREAFAFIAGTVLVAHNFEFEESFLTSAADRARLPLPPVVGLCTLQTSRRQLDGRAYSLTVMYKTATGEFPPNNHTALGDARAIRAILLWLLNAAPTPLNLTQHPPPTAPSSSQWECQMRCRPAAAGDSSVAALLASFPQSSRARAGDTGEVEKYLALLAECVEDGRLTYEESRSLTEQACRTRLTGTQLRDLHRQAWDVTFVDDKDADWVSLSPVRRREMYLLADALGLGDLAADLKAVMDSCVEPTPSPEARYLKGLRIGIVGDGQAMVELRQRAERYGAKLAINITKTVAWMATDTPDSTDAKHNSARKFGVPMVTSGQAAERLEEAIKDAELKAFERQREIDEYAARRNDYAAERDAYWRPTWRPRELDRDPEPEYFAY